MRLLAAALALAVPQPVAVARQDETTYALSGATAVYATDGAHAVTVRSLALDSGERRVADTVTLPPRQPSATPIVAASSERVAVGILTDDDEQNVRYSGVFAGPPAGPLGPLEPFTDRARTHHIHVLFGVDGPRVFTGDYREDFRSSRYLVHEPGVAEVSRRLPARSFALAFAGDRVAYFQGRGKLVVADWRTGAVERTIFPYDPDEPLGLRADGTVALVRGHRLLVAAPGSPPALLATVGDVTYGTLAWAGDRIAIVREDSIAVVEPDGTQRRLGPRTAYPRGVVADADHVMWRTHDCIVVADVTAGPSDAIGPGPCVRTEVEPETSARHRGRVVLSLRCVAGPGGVCRVTVQLVRGGRPRSRLRRLRLPVGGARRVRFRGRGRVRVVTIDPGGRRDVGVY